LTAAFTGLRRAELLGLRWRDIDFEASTIRVRASYVRESDIRRVQEWMGHADIQTTMKYLHYESRKEDAELAARAFRTADDGVEGPISAG
jgi:integrase